MPSIVPTVSTGVRERPRVGLDADPHRLPALEGGDDAFHLLDDSDALDRKAERVDHSGLAVDDPTYAAGIS